MWSNDWWWQTLFLFICSFSVYLYSLNEPIYLTLEMGIDYTILMLFSLPELTHGHFWCRWVGPVYCQSVNVTNGRQKRLLLVSIPGYVQCEKILPSLFVTCSISFPLFRRFYHFRLRNLFCNLLLSQTFPPHYDYKGLYFPVLLTPTQFCLWCDWNKRTVFLSSKEFRTSLPPWKMVFCSTTERTGMLRVMHKRCPGVIPKKMF